MSHTACIHIVVESIFKINIIKVKGITVFFCSRLKKMPRQAFKKQNLSLALLSFAQHVISFLTFTFICLLQAEADAPLRQTYKSLAIRAKFHSDIFAFPRTIIGQQWEML